MLITLSRRAANCQSVAEVSLTGVAPLGAVSHRFKFNFLIIIKCLKITIYVLFLDNESGNKIQLYYYLELIWLFFYSTAPPRVAI